MENQRLLSESNSRIMSGLEQRTKCPICCWPFLQEHLFSVDRCQHLFCQRCLTQHVSHQIQSMIIPVCPQQSCGMQIDFQSRFYKRMPLSLQKKTQKVFNYRRVLKDSTLKPCLSPDCPGLIDTKMSMKCGECGIQHCQICYGLKHQGQCQVRVAVGLEMRRKWRQCSDCGQVIQKTQGCTHMQCPCGNYFCYSCGETLHGEHQCLPPNKLSCLQTVRWQVQHLQLWYQRTNCTFLRLLLCLSPPDGCNQYLRLLWMVVFTLTFYPILVVVSIAAAVLVTVLMVSLVLGFSLLIPFIGICPGNLQSFPNICLAQSCGCCIAFLLVLLLYPLFYVVNLLEFIHNVLTSDQIPPLGQPFLQLYAGVKYVLLMPCLMMVSNEQYYLNSASLRQQKQIVIGDEML